ncbi:MAG: pilus assembly FimT family protein [Longimicrobiales bacterium]
MQRYRGVTAPCEGVRRTGADAQPQARRGFTLLEVVVTLLIVAIAAAVAAPAFRSLYAEDPLTTAEQRFEALFRLARDSAIRGGQPVTVVIDSISGLVWLDSPPFAGVADSVREARQAERDAGFGIRSSARAGRTDPSTAVVTNGMSLDLPGEVRLSLARARARFGFAPTGAAFPDTVWLRTSVVTRGITLDPWTGDATFF